MEIEKKEIEKAEQDVMRNTSLTFEEYSNARKPAIDAIINDYACNIIDHAKKNGEDITLEEARRTAEGMIPTAFVPEWMRNLRVCANYDTQRLAVWREVAQCLCRIEELLSVALGDQIDAAIEKEAQMLVAAQNAGNDTTEASE